MQAWRLTTKRYADTAFSGAGNRKAGSRWVPEGYLSVYTSEHLSLAIVENLVRFEARHFGDRHVVIPVEIPDDIPMDEVRVESLPGAWETLYEDDLLEQVGRDWIEQAQSAVLIVPSAVFPQERNLILNPEHQDFHKIVVGEPQPFRFDGRLHRG